MSTADPMRIKKIPQRENLRRDQQQQKQRHSSQNGRRTLVSRAHLIGDAILTSTAHGMVSMARSAQETREAVRMATSKRTSQNDFSATGLTQ